MRSDDDDVFGHTYEHPVECTGESEKAIRVSVSMKGIQFWVPKSVLHEDSEVYALEHTGKLVVKTWFAEKEGWD